MKVSEAFLKARKDKGVYKFIVGRSENRNEGKPYIRLLLEEKSKYGTEKIPVEILTETELTVESYGKQKEIETIIFHIDIYSFFNTHGATFLRKINKDATVKFRVLVNNTSESTEKVNFVRHELYGIINSDAYLLATYVGPDNTASPVRFSDIAILEKVN